MINQTAYTCQSIKDVIDYIMKESQWKRISYKLRTADVSNVKNTGISHDCSVLPSIDLFYKGIHYAFFSYTLLYIEQMVRWQLRAQDVFEFAVPDLDHGRKKCRIQQPLPTEQNRE